MQAMIDVLCAQYCGAVLSQDEYEQGVIRLKLRLLKIQLVDFPRDARDENLGNSIEAKIKRIDTDPHAVIRRNMLLGNANKIQQAA